MFASSARRSIRPAFVFAAATLLVSFIAPFAPAQESGPPVQQREVVAGTNDPSQAELEADRLVTLDADRVIDVLSQYPALMLEVKRRLVKLAFTQGRILEQSDLTDEALFRLIREDGNIRNVATREIMLRDYLGARRLTVPVGNTPGTDQPGAKQESPLDAPETKKPLEEQQRLRRLHQQQQYEEKVKAGLIIPSEMPPIMDGQAQSDTAPRRSTSTPATAPNTRRRWTDEDPQSNDENVAPMPRISPRELPNLIAAAQENGEEGTLITPPSSMTNSTRRRAKSSDNQQDDTGENPDDLLIVESGTARTSGGGTTSILRAKKKPPMELNDTHLESVETFPDNSVLRRHKNPYLNIPSLYDLYAQAAGPQGEIDRFGKDVFENGAGDMQQLPMDLPVGSDYVVGPGDNLKIDVWGSTSQRLTRVVDTAGRVALPQAGTVMIAGRSLADAQREIEGALRTQFRDVQADISVARLHSVRVYVVGDVERPGAYSVSALSTPLSAVLMAGGPSSRGSMRVFRHYRGKELVQQIDAYDIILNGVRGDVKPMQSGDTIVVPPISAQVTVFGMVRRPAIYEVKDEATLSDVLALAGGVLASGTLRHIAVERVEAHERREMLSLDLPDSDTPQTVDAALRNFKIQDGDRIRISPILPYSQKTVYLDGHVIRPGKYPYKDGMTFSDLVHSYQDLMPEPSLRHAEIIRLREPDHSPMVISVNLAEALKDPNLKLNPFDTVRIFSRFDFEDPPIVTVGGEVRQPGDHRTNGATYLRDAVYLAGGLTQDAQLDSVQVIRHIGSGKVKVISADLRRALAGDPVENVLLQPKDRVVIHRDFARTDPAMVIVEGEVGTPGKYPLTDGMTASQLVRLAGGIKRSADSDDADLTRFPQGKGTAGDHEQVLLAKALSGDAAADVELHDGDVLTIRQRTGWNDRGATITLRGEVVHPGTYGIREGEKLSSIIERAGGLRSDAFAFGAVLIREQVREIEEKQRIELLQRVESSGNILRGLPQEDVKDPAWRYTRDAAIQQWQATLDKLRLTPPSGRMVVRLSNDVKRWQNTANDIEVRAGDVLTIPKKPNFVMVTGSVYNPSAVSYRPGKSAEWYLEQGGGPTQMARKSAMFVIHADGSVSGTPGTLFGGGLRGISVKPGDTVVVPERSIAGPSIWQSVFQGVQAFSSIAVAASVMGTNL